MKPRNLTATLLPALLFFLAASLPNSTYAQKKNAPEPESDQPPAVNCAPGSGLSDAEVEKVQQFVTIIEMKPSGVVVAPGKIEQGSRHRPYTPDGARNHNFRVTPDLSDAQVSALVNHDRKRAQAVKSLLQMESAAAPGLIYALMFDGHEYRSVYAFLLGELGDARAVPALIKYYEDGQMKITLAASFRRMGDEEMAKQMEAQGAEMKKDAHAALVKIIGRDLGPDIEKYKAWWEANKHKCGPAIQLQLYTANPPAAPASP